MCRGMECLVKELGIVESEQFVYLIKADKMDYTEWRRWYFDSKSPEEIDRETEEYTRTHPFQGDKAVII